jgi:signal transduction histidine kinase
MRAFASDLFSALDVTLRFHAPAGTDAVPIGAELRREVFLIFKEAVTNAANHSGCTRVEVDLGFERGLLTLRVTDDGHGFDPVAASDGHGLHSLRDRARVIRGEMEVRSEPGRGTTVLLRAPGRTTGATRAGSDAALARG